MTLRIFSQLSAAMIFLFPIVAHAEIGLRVMSLGKLSPGLAPHDDQHLLRSPSQGV